MHVQFTGGEFHVRRSKKAKMETACKTSNSVYSDYGEYFTTVRVREVREKWSYQCSHERPSACSLRTRGMPPAVQPSFIMFSMLTVYHAFWCCFKSCVEAETRTTIHIPGYWLQQVNADCHLLTSDFRSTNQWAPRVEALHGARLTEEQEQRITYYEVSLASLGES